jgi:MinD-like ATPase involved in chromosome partitioning or flagellar assembly
MDKRQAALSIIQDVALKHGINGLYLTASHVRLPEVVAARREAVRRIYAEVMQSYSFVARVMDMHHTSIMAIIKTKESEND